MDESLIQAAMKEMEKTCPWFFEVLELTEKRALASAAIAAASEAWQARQVELLAANNAEVERRRAADKRLNQMVAIIANPPRHVYWGAGEPDCPADIKARNGELHTLRCKVCGDENERSGAICHAAISQPEAVDG